MDIETRIGDRRDGSEKGVNNTISLRVWGEDWGTKGFKREKLEGTTCRRK